MTESRIYGRWGGNPDGTPEDTNRCIAEVRPTNGWISSQCARKRGYGSDGLYCKQHDPSVAKKRGEIAKLRSEIKYRSESLYRYEGKRLFLILQQIAEGHNDPRALASEAIDPILEKIDELESYKANLKALES